MKKDILKRISQEENKLAEQDVDGHVWWNKFREFIEAIPESKKKKPINDFVAQECGNCATDFYTHEGEEKHKKSGMFLCSRCASQW